MIGLASTILAVYLYWETPKRYLSVLLIFFLITGGFQVIPLEYMLLPAIGVSKTYDWALVYVIIIFVIKPRILLNLIIWGDKNGLSVFGGVLCFLLLYNIFHIGTETEVSLRVFRNYIFFILLLPMAQLKHEDFIKVMRLLIYITTFASLLYCMQPFLGRGILNGVSVVNAEGGGLLRFYNMPYYIMPVLFTFFIRKSYFNLRFHYALLSINVFAIIVSQHRNMVLSIICCYLLYLLLLNKLNVKKVFIFGLISVGVFFGVDSYFNNRFSKGLVELAQSSGEVTPLVINSTNVSDISTSEFRRLHFIERFNYAKENNSSLLLGVGFLTEDAALVKQLSFNIGLTTDTGEVIQIDTSDIAWSLLIIHFGLIGIAAFIYFYLSYIKVLYTCRKEMMCVVGILYVATLFTNSFFGTDILLPHAIAFLMFIAAYKYSKKATSNGLQYSDPQPHVSDKTLPLTNYTCS